MSNNHFSNGYQNGRSGPYAHIQPQIQFETVNNRLYMDVEFLLKNTELALVRARQMKGDAPNPILQPQYMQPQPMLYQASVQQIQAQAPIVQAPKPRQIHHQSSKPGQQTKFVWDDALDEQFNIAAQAFGIKTVTPKMIGTALGHVNPEADLTRERLGSHLQKLRMKIMRTNAVVNLNELQNYHTQGNASEVVVRIAARFQDQLFQSYSMDQVLKFLHGNYEEI